MRPVRVPAVICVLAALSAGCSDGPPPKKTDQSASPKATPSREPRARLAGLAAAALDRRYTATYTYTPQGGTARPVPVTLGVDGSWRIDIPGGALGGTADISVVGVKDGTYQCAAPPPAGTPATPAASAAGAVSCVKLSSPVPAKYDVRLPYLFTDWLVPLTSPSAALSVVMATGPEGATGTCFSVEPTSASLAAPVDPGAYCYADDGVLTAIGIGVGTLVLAGPAAGPPATVTLPGPISTGQPLQLAALPAPSPTPTPRP